MAKKEKPKLLLRPQYETFAEKSGLSIQNNLVGYAFANGYNTSAFHYSLLNNKINCAMYDGPIGLTNVKILADESEIEKIDIIAEKLGGQKYKPTEINDYQ